MGIVKGAAQASGLVTQPLWGEDVEPRVAFVGLWWNVLMARFGGRLRKEAGSSGEVIWEAAAHGPVCV